MIASLLIGLREGLEAALIIGILYAYLVRVGRHDLLRPLWTGVAIAVGLSLSVGAALSFGPRTLSARAEETIAGVLSLAAVALITWMVFWLARASRGLKAHLEGAIDGALSIGAPAILTLSLIAVGREGLETALFVWAGVRSAGDSAGPLAGAVLGLAIAAALGILIARGAIRLNLTRFFRYTGVLLVVVAAGVLAYAVHELQEAGVLPGEDAMAFDVTATIPPDSWYGTLLRGIFSFRSRASVLEVVAYVAYLSVTVALYVRATRVVRPTIAEHTPTSLRRAVRVP